MDLNKVVVFDVGRVLVDFSFEPFEKFLVQNGAEVSNKQEFYDLTKLFKFERGELDSKAFIKLIQNLLKTEVRDTEIISQWVNIFNPINEMILYALDLKKKVRTLILSNTNSLHWEYLDDAFLIRSITEKAFTSYEVGAMKPDHKIYNALEEYAKVDPDNLYFIDDLKENVEHAIDRGWRGHVHQDVRETKELVGRFLEE